MPELPEVETVRRGLETALVGRTFSSVELRRKDLRTKIPRDLPSVLPGCRVTAVARRAKYLLIHTDGPTLLSHLGMTGSWTFTLPGQTPRALTRHDHVVWHFSDGSVAVFNDPRRFGVLEWYTSASLATLGKEPLDDEFTGAALKQALSGRKAPVKNLIMDQRVVVGVGNIYAAEALFRAGISPRRAGHRVTVGEALRLVETIKAVLREAIAVGGSSISDYRQVGGELGTFQHRFLVYDRAGQPCVHCAEPIRVVTLGGRSSFYCRRCQR